MGWMYSTWQTSSSLSHAHGPCLPSLTVLSYCVSTVQVLRVNGVDVLNLAHLKQLIMGKGSRTAAAAAVEPAAEPTAVEAAVTAAAAAATAGDVSSSGQQASSSNGHVGGNGSSSEASSSAGSSMDGSLEGDLEVGSAAWDAKFIQIELEDDRQIIMERSAASEATERLQRRYRVPYLCSADLAD